MRAKFINEKFTDDSESDAIHDMGIGEPEFLELIKNNKKLNSYMDFEVEDLDFSDVIETLDELKKIARYTVTRFFNRKYDFYLKNDPKAGMGMTFASVQLGKYNAQFSTSGPGKMIFIDFNSNMYRRERSIGARTIHSLDWKFQKICKDLNIPLKLKGA